MDFTQLLNKIISKFAIQYSLNSNYLKSGVLSACKLILGINYMAGCTQIGGWFKTMSDKLLFYWVIKFNKPWRAFKIWKNTFPQAVLVNAKSIVIVQIRFLSLRVGVFSQIDVKQKVVLENDCLFFAVDTTISSRARAALVSHSSQITMLYTRLSCLCTLNLKFSQLSITYKTLFKITFYCDVAKVVLFKSRAY